MLIFALSFHMCLLVISFSLLEFPVLEGHFPSGNIGSISVQTAEQTNIRPLDHIMVGEGYNTSVWSSYDPPMPKDAGVYSCTHWIFLLISRFNLKLQMCTFIFLGLSISITKLLYNETRYHSFSTRVGISVDTSDIDSWRPLCK